MPFRKEPLAAKKLADSQGFCRGRHLLDDFSSQSGSAIRAGFAPL
jgi:hypothetical protein